MKTEIQNPEAHAAFFNASQSAHPFVCKLTGETLSDGSVVWNVAFISKVVFCLDYEKAMALIEAVNRAVKKAK